MTSACTYSVASSARRSVDTTEHVLRPHTSAHTHRHTQRQADTHAGYGIHLSPYVCAIINKSEIARLQAPRSEYQTSGAEEGGSARLNRAQEEGALNWQPSVPITRTAVTATREIHQTPAVDDNNGGSRTLLEHLHEFYSSSRDYQSKFNILKCYLPYCI